MENIQKNNSKNDPKILIGIFFGAIMLMSLSLKFFTVTYLSQSLSLYMFNIKGMPIAIIVLIIYYYALFTKKKKLYYFTAILLFAYYGYILYAYLNFTKELKGLGEFVNGHCQFGDGFFFYTLSYILLLIDIFIPFKGSKIQNKNPLTEEMREQLLEIENQYLITNYIFGIEKRPDLYQKISVLIKNPKDDDVRILIEGEKIEELCIPLSSIIAISVKNSVVVKRHENEIRSTFADDLLAYAMCGYLGMMISQTEVVQKFLSYDKMDYRNVFDIEIAYKENGEDKKLMLQTKTNPKKFFEENFKEKYQQI